MRPSIYAAELLVLLLLTVPLLARSARAQEEKKTPEEPARVLAAEAEVEVEPPTAINREPSDGERAEAPTSPPVTPVDPSVETQPAAPPDAPTVDSGEPIPLDQPREPRAPSSASTVRDFLDFAEDLYDHGDYRLAILEFRRVQRLATDSQLQLYAFLYMISCYIRLGDYDHALFDLASVPRGETPAQQAEILREVKLKLGEVHFLRGNYDLAATHLSGFIDRYPDDPRTHDVRLKLAMAYTNTEAWDKARTALEQAQSEDPSIADALALLGEGPPHPTKSPVLAGLMSTLIPGAGQIYAGRVVDGLVAFALVGVFAFGVVEAIMYAQYGFLGVVSFFGLGWYTGNIFSAVNSAHRYNRQQHQAFKEDLIRDLHMAVEPSFTGKRANLSDPMRWSVSFSFLF